jgi:hypothetical protein
MLAPIFRRDHLIDRYGDKKDIILGSSAEKLFLGPITDKASRDEIAELLGQHAIPLGDRSTLVPKAWHRTYNSFRGGG